MTNAELNAGALAVEQIAQKYHVAGWLNINHYREIAAAVIAAHDRVHAEAAAAHAAEAARLVSIEKTK